MQRALLRVVLSTTLLAAVGCTGEGPDIHQLRQSTIAVYNLETDSLQEALSVFAYVTHPHSLGDLELLKLRHEESELEWQRRRDNWSLRQLGDRTFIGAAGFYAPGGESLPRGRYELVIEDIGGRSAVTQFEVRTLDYSLERAEFPTLEIATAPNDGSTTIENAIPRDFRVRPQHDEIVVTARNGNDEVVGRYVGEDFAFSLEELSIDENTDSIANLRLFVQTYLQRSQVWFISGPWTIGEL